METQPHQPQLIDTLTPLGRRILNEIKERDQIVIEYIEQGATGGEVTTVTREG